MYYNNGLKECFPEKDLNILQSVNNMYSCLTSSFRYVNYNLPENHTWIIGASLSEPHVMWLTELHRNALWCVRTRNVFDAVIKIVSAFHTCSYITRNFFPQHNTVSWFINRMHAIMTVTELKDCK